MVSSDWSRTIQLPRRFIGLFLALILIAFLASPAVAAYIGPNRTTITTAEVRDPDNDMWELENFNPPPPYTGVCLIKHTCEEHPSVERQLALCGWIADNSGCTRAYKTEEQTITLPEATIKGQLVGCTPNNGWCTTPPLLHLSAYEPISGEIILLIEGSRNGSNFACELGLVECAIPLVESSNDFEFWALSSYDDSSQKGMLSVQVDTVPPVSAFSSPVNGSAVWVSGVLEMAGASADAASGIVSAELSLNGGASWAALSLGPGGDWTHTWDTSTVPDGTYQVLVRASDMAGHVESTARITVHVDLTPPSLSIPDEWYIWEPLAVGVDDGGVGVKTVDLTIDGGPYGQRTYKWSASYVPDGFIWDRHLSDVIAPIGEYTVTVSATDDLGNHSSATGKVIIPPPEARALLIQTQATGDVGQNGTVESAEPVRKAPSDSSGQDRTNDSSAAASTNDLALSQAKRDTSSSPGPTVNSSPAAIVPSLVTTTGVRWGEAALGLAGIVAGYGSIRRASRRAQLRLDAPVIANPLEFSPALGVAEAELEFDATRDFLDWLKLRAEGASGLVDTVIALARDQADAPSALTALWRLLRPELSPSPTYTDILTQQLARAASRGDFVDHSADLLQQFEDLGAATAPRRAINYTDLKQLLEGLRRPDALGAYNDLLSVALILAGERALRSDPAFGTLAKRLGESLGATGDLWQGGRILVNPARFAEYAKFVRTPWGVLSSGVGGLAGLLQLAAGTDRLVSDPSIRDLGSNERWGVFMQTLGGGLLFVGSAAAILVAAGIATGAIAAGLTVLVPLGLVIGTVGFVIENLGWIRAGVGAYFGAHHNAWQIVRAIPSFVNGTVVQPALRSINDRIVQPVASGLKSWEGVAANGRRIVEALPGYVQQAVLEPATELVSERIIEPIRNGLQAWPGVFENGRQIIQALPDYVAETVIRPSVHVIDQQIVGPAVRALEHRVLAPVAHELDRAIIQPLRSFRSEVVQPAVETMNTRVVQPVVQRLDRAVNAVRSFFGWGS